MEESEFLEKILKAVREAEMLLLDHSHLSLWHVAAQGGISAGFKINTNGLESENKVLLAIKGLVNTTLYNSKDHLYEMILIEKAWEYYQMKEKEAEGKERSKELVALANRVVPASDQETHGAME